MKTILVKSNNSRLDKYLIDQLQMSRSKIQHLICNQTVYVNNELVKKNGLILKINDLITFDEQKNLELKDQTQLPPYKFELTIVYEDPYFLIINKPSGMLVHSTSFNEQDTLMNAVIFYSKESQQNFQPFLVHRLDKDTAGLIIIAKDEKTLSILQKMFENKQILKKYFALAHNRLNQQHILIDVPISRSYQSKLRMKAGTGKNEKRAISEVWLIQNFKQHCLLDVAIQTGRTHQIRVHLRHINHPIVNDPIYGIDKNISDYKQCLIAYHLCFEHPITKKSIDIKIEKDEQFKKFIDEIERIK